MRRLTLFAVVAAVAIPALAGCGSSSQQPVDPGAGPHINTSIELANCHDWEQASTEERLGTLAQLKNFAGGPVVGNNATTPAGRGAVLDDKKAYDLLDNYCKQSFAAGFKLYLLYQRAASFSGKPAQ
jgi:hypothetical protein